MKVQHRNAIFPWRGFLFALPLCLGLAISAPAQIAAAPAASGCTLPPDSSHTDNKAPSKLTPEQARQLFALVDVLIKFSSDETGLPIKSTVKRQLTSRDAVVKYLEEKFNEDEGTKRLQRDEIVLKKFGLLDHDFSLKPFLLDLLKEQIEAYYDSKTKTVNLLDWVGPDDEQPVLAHELTHALQDQHSDLEKWDDQTPDDVSTDAAGDLDHLAKDEMDTARDAVAEGQATAVMWDCELKPMGKSLIKDPEVLELVKTQMGNTEDSPVMARAPLLLSESMLFPYREGLSFEQDVWMDQGQTAAFAGTLDRLSAAAGFKPRIRHTGSSESHIQAMAAATLGVALSASRQPVPEALIAKPLAEPSALRNLVLVTVAGRPQGSAVNAFVKLMRARDWDSPA